MQTLTFNDITQRRGWYVFPDSTHAFRKVLMHHTLKCDPQTTQDQYACGEWDYLTYNQVHEHTGAYDSTALTHPLFKVGAQVPISVERADQLGWHQRQSAIPFRNVLATSSESGFTVGDASGQEMSLLDPASLTTRAQYHFTADELTAAGLQAGPIQQIAFQSLGGGDAELGRITVRMKHSSVPALTALDEAGLVTVHEQAGGNAFQAAGETRLVLAVDFAWNGTSGILVDIAVEKTGVTGPALQASVLPDRAVMASGRNGVVEVDNDFLGIEAAPLGGLGSTITVMFRAKGDDVIPTVNTTVFEAVDAQDRRILNVHLPWSDGRVYWDAGNDGSSFDRIDKVTVEPNVEGQWNHWAFVKNTATGSMKIYLNGSLWHSGTGKTKPMAGITRFKFASDRDGGWSYPGQLDEIAVFAAEVSAANINAWKSRRIDASHPDAAQLLYSFHCDEALDQHELANSASTGARAWAMGTVARRDQPAADLVLDAVPSSLRPDITFYQGQYDFESDADTIGWPEPMPLLTEEFFQVQGNSAQPFDTLFAFLGGQSYTYGPDGAPLDSSTVASVTDVNDTINYFGVPFELLNDWEIGRYITPYGIGLSLGPQGFRWTFDVTDYQWLLHDSVDLSAGNQQELIDLEFEMIEGLPPRPLVRQQRPWGGLTSRSYADLSGDVAFPPVQVQLSPEAVQWSLRTRLTGHGHNSNNGQYPHCCEWKDNTHYLSLNGTQVDAWHIWQENDCALNPVHPQGGTWLGSREGWCPGDLVKDHEVELPGLTSGGTATLDYAITPVPTNNLGMGGGNYVMNMDLMEFGPASLPLDAEIYEVKRPSRTDMWRRANPICRAPLVVLRNAGAQDLTSAVFTYSVSGGQTLTHTWTGLLKHMQRAEIELPVNDEGFWLGDDDRIFTATVSQPNGGADAYDDNNSYRTAFDSPTAYPHPIILHYKTNNRPNENAIRILDIDGNVVHSRTVHTANTQYIDTLDLPNGCYTFEMTDSGNDGLSYWADPDAGSGYARFKKPNGVIVHYFANEFGHSLHKAFSIAIGVGMPEVRDPLDLSVVPNPTNANAELRCTGIRGDGMLEVLDAQGRLLTQRNVVLRGDDRIGVDLLDRPAGMYLIRLHMDDQVQVLRAMKE